MAKTRTGALNKKKSILEKTSEKKLQPASEKPNFLVSLESFFKKNQNTIFYVGLALTVILGALLFDLKISEGTDDSDYIMSAHNFLAGKAFPTFHGSFYPIFLSFFILLFGIKLVMLKMLSFVLIVGHLIFLFYAFRNKIPATILCMVILLVSINSSILFFASTTFSEPLYIFLQSLIVYLLFAITDRLEDQSKPIFAHWKIWLSLGLCSFLFSNTRNIGLGIIVTLILYFVIHKQYKAILYSIVSFLVFQIPFSIYKNIYWKMGEVGFEGQFGAMLYKNPYYHQLGKENFAGILARFLRNSENYFSIHFLQIIGLRSANGTTINIFLTFLIYFLLIVSAIIVLRKKNRYLTFVALYLTVAIGATFISIQSQWNQSRLILIYVPLMLILFSYTIYEIGKNYKFRFLQPALILVFIVAFLSSAGKTGGAIKETAPVLVKNLKGDPLYGYTPDLINYFKVSKWAAEHLPKNAVIACRKPSMSFIYGNGRDFFGIYSLPKINVDSAIMELQTKYSEVVILDIYELTSRKIDPNFLGPYYSYISMVIVSEKHFCVVYTPPADVRNKFISFLKENKWPFMLNLSNFSALIKKSNEDFFAENPDYLYNYLKSNKVKFILLGSFRMNINKKTDQIVNTLHRFINFTALKYPKSFRIIYEVGGKDEPAQVVEFRD
jgi:hypothetical protein